MQVGKSWSHTPVLQVRVVAPEIVYPELQVAVAIVPYVLSALLNVTTPFSTAELMSQQFTKNNIGDILKW